MQNASNQQSSLKLKSIYLFIENKQNCGEKKVFTRNKYGQENNHQGLLCVDFPNSTKPKQT